MVVISNDVTQVCHQHPTAAYTTGDAIAANYAPRIFICLRCLAVQYENTFQLIDLPRLAATLRAPWGGPVFSVSIPYAPLVFLGTDRGRSGRQKSSTSQPIIISMEYQLPVSKDQQPTLIITLSNNKSFLFFGK